MFLDAMKLRNLIVVVCSMLILSIRSDAQTIPVVKFSDLEPMLTTESDTLYVVNFWATWCKPCIEEMPYFVEAEKSLSAQKVKFIMVSLDFPKMIDSRLKPFLKKNKVPGQVIVLNDPNSNSWIPKVNEEWDGAIPVTLIFNRKNRIFINIGFDNTTDLLKNINALKI